MGHQSLATHAHSAGSAAHDCAWDVVISAVARLFAALVALFRQPTTAQASLTRNGGPCMAPETLAFAGKKGDSCLKSAPMVGTSPSCTWARFSPFLSSNGS